MAMQKSESVAVDRANRQSLLIIDDDKNWTDLLRLYFLEKYEVMVVNSACEAMEAISKERPSLIIVDLVMPTIDGFGIIRRLNDSNQASIPTILLTGWHTAEVEECASSVGCSAVLSKPIEMNELEETVSSLIKKRPLWTAAML